MTSPFFPHLAFAWTFLAILAAILVSASYIDTRSLKIPKPITVTTLALGLLFNLIRGVWLGNEGQAVWSLGASEPWVGLVDGVLFAAAGAIVGFTLFFIMWVLGACGGGDVKLSAAIGAWIGPMLAIKVLMVTIPVVFAFVIVRFLIALAGGDIRTIKRFFSRKKKTPAATLAAGSRLLAFSLPLTLATLFVLFWSFKTDLHLMPATEAAHAQAQGGTNAQ
jgi:Flp pilus assembly protein protease CpaA